MPLRTIQKTYDQSELRGFRGVNLRRDRLSLADEDLARAINADLHTKPGIVILRKGRTPIFETPLAGRNIRRLHRLGTSRYIVSARNLYRHGIASAQPSLILSNLSRNLFTTLLSLRPFNDSDTWVFIADDAQMYKDNGSDTYRWGIAAPTNAPSLSNGDGTGLTGAYSAVYTYVRLVGGLVAHESNPSDPSNTVNPSDKDIDIDVTASGDEQVTNIYIYRTVAGGSVYLYDRSTSNDTATRTLSNADSALGVAVETDNDVPPDMSWVVEHQGHAFGVRDASYPHYLRWAKRFRPESWAPDNYIAVGNPDDPLLCAVSFTGFLGVWTPATKYRILGNDTQGFTHLEAVSKRGTRAPQATIGTEIGAVFVASDGVFSTQMLQPDLELSQSIEPMFHDDTVHDNAPIEWAEASSMALARYKQRLYFAYTNTAGERLLAVLSADTGNWYFYDHPATALYREEDADRLVAGLQNGIVYFLEEGYLDAGSAITMTFAPAERGQWEKRRFDYAYVDADAMNGTVSVAIQVDGRTVRTLSITGARLRRRLRLPDGCVGTTWTAEVKYSGSEPVEVYAIRVLYLPLGGI